MVHTKHCKRCQRDLPVEQFYKHGPTKLSSRCRSCHGIRFLVCVVCGAQFEGHQRAKLCSDRCRAIYRPQTFGACGWCGREFGPLNHLVRQYCSRACAYAAQATGRKAPTQCTPQARAAQRQVQYTIETGRWVRPDRCSQCGGNGRIEAAHEDYSDPLRVRWLCRSCHVRWDHREPKGGCVREGAAA